MRETRFGGGSWLRLPGNELDVQRDRDDQQRPRLERPRILAGRNVGCYDPHVADVVPARAARWVRTIEGRREQSCLIERADKLHVIVVVRDAVLLQTPRR